MLARGSSAKCRPCHRPEKRWRLVQTSLWPKAPRLADTACQSRCSRCFRKSSMRAPTHWSSQRGGIADGRGMAAALMLGAQGVLMGTRFYALQEAEGHAEAKRRILEA